jgi:hypothetical protein
MCISHEFQRYIPLVTAYVFILLFEHESTYLTLSYVGASADCSIAIKPKNGVSPSFVLSVLPLTLCFLFSDPSSLRSTAVHVWSSHHYWQFDQFAFSKAVLRFLVYGSDSSVRLNRVFDIFIS